MEKWIFNTFRLKLAQSVYIIIFVPVLILYGCADKSNSSQQEDRDKATERRANSEISSLSTVIVSEELLIFRKESEVDSLMQWWFMLGEAESVNDYINVLHPEKKIGKLSECSPESLLAFSYYLSDILKGKKTYKRGRFLNLEALYSLIDSIKGTQINFSLLKSTLPLPEEEYRYPEYGSISADDLSDENISMLRALAGEKSDITSFLSSKNQRYTPERIALYLSVIASVTKSPELRREGGLELINGSEENVRYFSGGINLLKRAQMDGDATSDAFLRKIDNTLRAIFGSAPNRSYGYAPNEIDSETSIKAACGTDYMPNLWYFMCYCYIAKEYYINTIFDFNGSFIRKLPILFFGGTYYSNNLSRWNDVGSSFYHTTKNINLWLNDCCIENIEQYRDTLDVTLVDNLRKKYLSGLRQIYPDFIHDNNYPYESSLVIFPTNNITEIDSLRIETLCGNKEATERLEEYYRSKDAIGEMAYYYYFQALSENNPDKMFRAAQMMYEDSHQRPYALAGMINMLKAGKRMGSEQCATALYEIYQVASNLK